MKKIVLVILVMGAVLFSLSPATFAQPEQGVKPPSTSTKLVLWTPFLPNFGAYDANFNGNNAVVSTIDVDTSNAPFTLTHVTLRSTFGPTAGGTLCTLNPGVEISNGIQTYSLRFSNPANHNGQGGTFSDSGTLNIPFTTGGVFFIEALPGAPDDTLNECDTLNTNVSVEFSQ